MLQGPPGHSSPFAPLQSPRALQHRPSTAELPSEQQPPGVPQSPPSCTARTPPQALTLRAGLAALLALLHIVDRHLLTVLGADERAGAHLCRKVVIWGWGEPGWSELGKEVLRPLPTPQHSQGHWLTQLAPKV